MQLTSGQAFYARLSAAVESRDRTALAALYHPDVMMLSVTNGQTLRGRDAVLADIEQTAAFTGPIRQSVTGPNDRFVEYADVIAVEATHTTRIATYETYDVYLLHNGAIRYQFGGTISPRQPAAALALGPPTTAEQQFLFAYRAASHAADGQRLRALYRPDAVDIIVSLVMVDQGADRIVSRRLQGGRVLRPQDRGLTRLVDGPGYVCAEAVTAQHLGQTLIRGAPVEVLGYSICLLQDGAIRFQFTGFIKPRAAEILGQAKQLHEHNMRAWDSVIANQAWRGRRR
jgi:ketosteroid isomerase-like protein